MGFRDRLDRAHPSARRRVNAAIFVDQQPFEQRLIEHPPNHGTGCCIGRSRCPEQGQGFLQGLRDLVHTSFGDRSSLGDLGPLRMKASLLYRERFIVDQTPVRELDEALLLLFDLLDPTSCSLGLAPSSVELDLAVLADTSPSTLLLVGGLPPCRA